MQRLVILLGTLLILTPLLTAGAIYKTPIRSRNGTSLSQQPLGSNFVVVDFKAVINDAPTAVIENPGSLRYVASLFKCTATLKCAVPVGKSVTVGFVQQVDSLEQRQDYSRAFTTWEQPSLPVCDYVNDEPPWMDTQHERIALQGGTGEQEVEISMNDQPFSNTSWHEPLPPHGKQEGPFRDLQHIARTEHFTTWLIAREDDTKLVTVLRKVTWSYRIDISVNSQLPLGSRATVNLVPAEKPTVETPDGTTEAAMVIPPQSLKGPSANDSSQLWWNAKIGDIRKRVRLQ